MIHDDDRPHNDHRSMRDFRRIADKKTMEATALSEAAGAVDKRLRMRRFTWVRAENAAYDDKIWRLVARRAGAPLHLVEAFVLRLDLHASAARPRGSLDGFSIEALAAHWGLANDDILARIYAALESPEVGWIEGEHLVTFWDRNPDTEDTTAADRTHRSKAFKKAMKTIVAYKREGRIDAGGEAAMVHALWALREEARAGHFPRGELVRRLALVLQLSTERGAHDVTTVTTVSLTPRSDQKFITAAPVDNFAGGATPDSARPGDVLQLSTERGAHDVTTVTTVSLTPRSDQKFITAAPVDNFAGGATPDSARPGDGPGPDEAEPGNDHQPDERQRAILWLDTDGTRIVCEQLQGNRTLASTRIARWRDQELAGDAVALVGVIKAADRSGLFGLRFLNLVVDGIRAAQRTATAQRELALPPVPIGAKKAVGNE